MFVTSGKKASTLLRWGFNLRLVLAFRNRSTNRVSATRSILVPAGSTDKFGFQLNTKASSSFAGYRLDRLVDRDEIIGKVQ